MNEIAKIGHNSPPDPIDEAVAPFADTLSEAENWLDGEPIETEDQMKAVDELIKAMRKAGSELEKAKKATTAPLYDAWKGEIARWKPTEDDFERIKSGLVALVAPIKKRLKAEQEAEAAAAAAEARRKQDEARQAAERANAADIEAQRKAAEKMQEAEEATKAAAAAKKDQVKGLRTVTMWQITSYSDFLRWMNKNDRPALEAFCEEYARKHHRDGVARPGLRVWTEKEAY